MTDVLRHLGIAVLCAAGLLAADPVLTVLDPATSTVEIGVSTLHIDGFTDLDAAVTIADTGGTAVPVSSPGGVFSHDLTGLTGGLHTIVVRAVDVDGHVTESTVTVKVDLVGPTVVLGAPSAARAMLGDIVHIDPAYDDLTAITVNLQNTDVELSTDGTATATVQVDPVTYRISLSGFTGDGTLSVRVKAGSAQDALIHPASASAPVTVIVDNSPPVLVSVSPEGSATTAATAIPVTIVFDEALVRPSGLTVTPGAHATVASATSTDGITWSVVLTPTSAGVVSITDIEAEDLLGWTSTASTGWSLATYAAGFASTVEQDAGQADATSTGPIRFTVTFAQAIAAASFTTADLVVGGSAGGVKTATITEVTAGTVYRVAVSGMTTSGTVTLALPIDRAETAGGQTNLAATSVDASVDWVAPQISYDLTPGAAACGTGSGLMGLIVGVLAGLGLVQGATRPFRKGTKRTSASGVRTPSAISQSR